MINCTEMEVYYDGENCISKWTLSWLDKLKLLFGNPIWTYVHGKTHPPIALTIKNPFD